MRLRIYKPWLLITIRPFSILNVVSFHNNPLYSHILIISSLNMYIDKIFLPTIKNAYSKT